MRRWWRPILQRAVRDVSASAVLHGMLRPAAVPHTACQANIDRWSPVWHT
jgi:hypothetical protein